MMDYLISIGQSFRIADLFDIAIMFALIYLILFWFRKAASRLVFVGISILGLVYVLARFFHLYLTIYVLHGFFAILLVAMVVIFQEDIRRLFERIAMWRFSRKRRSSMSSHQEIDILSGAVTELAIKRFGALIVLRGDDHLDRHLKGGTPLEGKLSEPLLESIFDPHSVGHDGAVIVENDRVVKFGCHLPLSLNTLKVANLGLRHTAALGLAERSDALCIVVSEERGTISVAREERLEELDGPDQLKTILERFYQETFPRTTKQTWFRRIKENPWEKAIAIFLACGLWLAFGYQTGSVRRDFVVPIEYRNLVSDWIIEEPKPKEATVTLVGAEQAFALLNPQALLISLDMAKIQKGKQELALEEGYVRRAANLSVLRIEPSKINITAHQMVSLDVPIKVRTSGKLPSGLIIRRITVIPKSIQVVSLSTGKEHLEILTESIHLQEIKSTVTLTPRLVFPTHIRFANNKPPQVRVTIEVEPENTKKGNNS